MAQSEWNSYKTQAQKLEKLGRWICDEIHHHNRGDVDFTALCDSESYITEGMFFFMRSVQGGVHVQFGLIHDASITNPFDGMFEVLFERVVKGNYATVIKHVGKSFGIDLPKSYRRMLNGKNNAYLRNCARQYAVANHLT